MVAQQLLTIQNALRIGADKFWFEGRPIRLEAGCACMITSNPGYAGRTELPDNLKVGRLLGWGGLAACMGCVCAAGGPCARQLGGCWGRRLHGNGALAPRRRPPPPPA